MTFFKKISLLLWAAFWSSLLPRADLAAPLCRGHRGGLGQRGIALSGGTQTCPESQQQGSRRRRGAAGQELPLAEQTAEGVTEKSRGAKGRAQVRQVQNYPPAPLFSDNCSFAKHITGKLLDTTSTSTLPTNVDSSISFSVSSIGSWDWEIIHTCTTLDHCSEVRIVLENLRVKIGNCHTYSWGSPNSPHPCCHFFQRSPRQVSSQLVRLLDLVLEVAAAGRRRRERWQRKQSHSPMTYRNAK